ncbi:MAG TPA: SgcJ/EcaC family oxidoreductase [Rhizomicrobium sp.]|nr:SgcJ/EcaC family oxidoreductase [Rhizomicrobium sp.]
MKNLLAAIACLLISAGIADADPVPELAKKQIDAVNANWVLAMEAGDAHRASLGFAEDSIFVGPTGQVLNGRAAYEALVRGRFAKGLKITDGWVKQTDVRYVDDEVIEWGHSKLMGTDAQGRKTMREGLYVAVWKQGKDGSWKIVRNLSL